jgi:HSP20 family protein
MAKNEANPGAPSELATYTPRDFWTDVERWFQEFDQGSCTAIRSPTLGNASIGRGPGVVPAAADVVDLGGAFQITADPPGAKKGEIDVRVVGNTVLIQSEPGAEKTEKGREFLRRERTWSGFHRAIELPEPVKAEDVTAKFEDGVLVVTVPKAQPTVEKKVRVA